MDFWVFLVHPTVVSVLLCKATQTATTIQGKLENKQPSPPSMDGQEANGEESRISSQSSRAYCTDNVWTQ